MQGYLKAVVQKTQHPIKPPQSYTYIIQVHANGSLRLGISNMLGAKILEYWEMAQLRTYPFYMYAHNISKLYIMQKIKAEILTTRIKAKHKKKNVKRCRFLSCVYM